MVEKNIKKQSDGRLVELARNGYPEAFREIVERYQEKLTKYLKRNVGNSSEVHDLAQEIFIKVYKNLKSFDVSRKFSPWIYRIAHNEAVNHLKRKSHNKEIQWEDFRNYENREGSAASSIEDLLIRKDDWKKAGRFLSLLRKEYKEILELRYFKELSYKEISNRTGKPLNTVGTLISRAKKKLRKIIAEK